MKTGIRKYLLLPILFVIYYAQAYGQVPSGHAEVWQNVEKYWELWGQRDLDGFLEFHHIAYSGWNYNESMHKGKKSIKEWLDYDFETIEIITFDINVIDIKIHNDIAVVHYYYSILEKNTKGKPNKRNGRKTDILLKQTNKWVIIADHGGDMHKN